MSKMNPAKFIQETRAEAAKVVWPTRRETIVTTIMVFVMATVAAIFFFIVDQVIGLGVNGILSIAG
ncbi:preprotein translocase subunit SecE [Rhodovulum sp. DZ06]|uniref:preprotein translocase subunit SecE n=1 Tax=Rhodovulum sp. DZ06 TaxID=3425126 RepID=UPI003D352837